MSIKETLTTHLQVAREAGLSRSEVLALVDETFPPRLAAGMEVTEGWEMPAAPRGGMIPCFEMHGRDGMCFYWWDASWGKYPNEETSFRKMREGNLLDTLCDDEPLAHPDTGSNHKQTADALRELGFHG